jgi:hypothetical protein
MQRTKRAAERLTKLSKKLPSDALLWIEHRAEELARTDLLSSAMRMKHVNEAYEQWKQEHGVGVDYEDHELDHEAENATWLGKKTYCALMRPNGRVLITHEATRTKFTFTPEEAYDLFYFLRGHRDELSQKAQQKQKK